MPNTTISMREVKDLLNYTIDNNFKRQEDGKIPIAIGFEASAGIGKTSSVEQVAAERNMGCVKIPLAQLEEAGDLVGFPMKEYECQVAKSVKQEDGSTKMQVMPKTVWLNEKLVSNPPKGIMYRQTGETRMGYAKPAWVPEYNENGTILLLDDYSRANQQLLQAVMEVILTQKYVSWTLPKKTQIVLTSNCDDGTNNVNSLDEAQRTRLMNYEVAFDEESWSQWAESAGVDGRCINFVMSYSNELFSPDEMGNRICNPRSFVMFADMIEGVKDWDNADSQAFITTIAKGCFKDEGGKFSRMFSAFLRNKMHTLIQPKEMLLGSWDKVSTKLTDTLYDSGKDYRPDIASLLERRFSNYVHAWLDSKDNTPIATVQNRILDFIRAEHTLGKILFNKDLFYHMIKTITSAHKNQTNRLLYEPEIAKMLA